MFNVGALIGSIGFLFRGVPLRDSIGALIIAYTTL